MAPPNESQDHAVDRRVCIQMGTVCLEGALKLPQKAAGVVLFAHGIGCSRHSPHSQFVAGVLLKSGVGTLLFDLLTHDEEQQDAMSGALRFDITLLATRLIGATLWVRRQPETRNLKVVYFGTSTGGAAALVAAAGLVDEVSAVVSRGGRPDLAGDALPGVKCPTLFIVGGYDEMVICLNDDAFEKLRCVKDFRIVPGATHFFEEPGKLEQVAHLSAGWFHKHLVDNGDGDERISA